MAAGAGKARVCSVIVASTAMMLLVTGCGGSHQQESSPFNGPAAASKAPVTDSPPPADVATQPDIVTTGSVRMTVDDPVAAADQFTSATTKAGGASSPATNRAVRVSPLWR